MKAYQNIPSMYDILDFCKSKDFDSYKDLILKKLINKILEEIKNIISISKEFDNFSKEEFLEYIYLKLKENIYNIENKYKKLINATGIILHTNIGRAPISKGVLERAIESSISYLNIEYDINTGQRIDRNIPIAELLRLLIGCEDAVLVNNNASALLLISNTFCNGKDLLLSRGELIEIGDSFRILDILDISGAKVKEVGSTNRTYISDYAYNIDENTSAILKVSKSNYEISGFSSEVPSIELAKLCKENDIFLVEDLGSGLLTNTLKEEYGFSNIRNIVDSIEDGVDLLCFSTDKILSSTQGAIIAGRKDFIDKLKKNPMYRALRAGKNTIAIIYETLKLYLRNEEKYIPIISILSQSEEELYQKSKEILDNLEEYKDKIEIFIEKSKSYIGGGASSTNTKDSYAVCMRPKYIKIGDFQKELRNYRIISNIKDGYLKIDTICIEKQDIAYVSKSIINILNTTR
ncbi:L-seryl-tRNA(Sec) selenium transferase [[Eubacterium] yurii]|jgi:L-seryl-tRNA(Sec) selenium transferase|nr:L-seryl-tRNA(Sec) selenium transferase [[Eubacterium] yurii]